MYHTHTHQYIFYQTIKKKIANKKKTELAKLCQKAKHIKFITTQKKKSREKSITDNAKMNDEKEHHAVKAKMFFCFLE